jgi:hypothetical protein
MRPSNTLHDDVMLLLQEFFQAPWRYEAVFFGGQIQDWNLNSA